MTHELKCLQEQWPYYKNGSKNSSMRKNDRNFSVGDICILKLWNGRSFVSNEIVVRKITHIVNDWEFAKIPEGYCLLSFREVL